MNRTVDLFFNSRAFVEEELRGKTVVVIDVLRACSTIVTALAYGAKGVVPVRDLAEAGPFTQNLDPTRFVMCGERDGVKIDGYHFGNSPLEFKPEDMENKTVVLSTTNGTVAITRASLAKNLHIACLLNAGAVANHLKTLDQDIFIICAGWKNRLSIEDTLCAGYILSELFGEHLPESARDGARIAHALYQTSRDRIADVVKSSNHAARLRELDYGSDIDYCSELNKFNLVPVLREGIIR
jgi:2-phosphosulfolactate phosphatase